MLVTATGNPPRVYQASAPCTIRATRFLFTVTPLRCSALVTRRTP
ncbi:hypothetical protein GCM10027028_21630 [Streptomyces sundarbansensis]